jgi:hypothetical protein
MTGMQCHTLPFSVEMGISQTLFAWAGLGQFEMTGIQLLVEMGSGELFA